MWQKVYWSLLIGVVAIVMFLVGGIQALQTATILSALPFAIFLLFATYGLNKALKIDFLKSSAIGGALGTSPTFESGNWKSRIRSIVNIPRLKQIQRFLGEDVIKCFESLSEEFTQQGLEVKIKADDDRVTLHIHHEDEIDFVYQIRIREFEPPSFTLSDQPESRTYYRAEVFLKEGGQNYDVMGYAKDQIIADVIDQYEKHLHFLSLIR